MILILHRNHNREQSLATSNNRYSTPVFMSKDPTLEDQQKEDYPDMSEFEVSPKFIIAYRLSVDINI